MGDTVDRNIFYWCQVLNVSLDHNPVNRRRINTYFKMMSNQCC